MYVFTRAHTHIRNYLKIQENLISKILWSKQILGDGIHMGYWPCNECTITIQHILTLHGSSNFTYYCVSWVNLLNTFCITLLNLFLGEGVSTGEWTQGLMGFELSTLPPGHVSSPLNLSKKEKQNENIPAHKVKKCLRLDLLKTDWSVRNLEMSHSWMVACSFT